MSDLFGNEPTKRCMRCKQHKPASEFPRSAKRWIRTCEACRNLTEKPCTDCKEIKAIADYAVQRCKDGKLRAGSICHSCRARRCREWNAKHRTTKVRNQNLLKNYGITLAVYHVMFDRQLGACAICGETAMPIDPRTNQPYQLAVDHDHLTGAVRELLCPACNNGLGCFKDDPVLLHKAINYLQKHS